MKVCMVYKTKHFVLHYERGSPVEEDIELVAERLEEAYNELLSRIPLEEKFGVEVYLYRDSYSFWSAVGEEFLAAGLVFEDGVRLVYLDSESVCVAVHELTHIHFLSFKRAPPLLEEGIAVAVTNYFCPKKDYVDRSVAAFLDQNNLVPLKEYGD